MTLPKTHFIASDFTCKTDVSQLDFTLVNGIVKTLYSLSNSFPAKELKAVSRFCSK